MATTTFDLEATPRTDVGKGASRRLRRTADLVPAIIYGAKEKPEMICLSQNKVKTALQKPSFYSRILTLKIDDKFQPVILKAIQRHPIRPQVLHMDFLRIKADEEMEMNIPLRFFNEEIAPGVKVGGGVVTRYMKEVEIRCLPADLPEFIDVDLSALELDRSITLSELKLPNKVSLTANVADEENDLPVVAIHIPKEIEEVEAAAPTATETEITTEKKEEEPAKEGSNSTKK